MKNQNELIKIWKCFSDIPAWLRLLWLTEQYTEEELDEMGRIDDEFNKLEKEERVEWHKWLRKELPKTPQGWLEVFPEAKHLVKPMSRKQKKFREQLEIARGVDLESVVEQYVDLRRSGAYRKVGLCPFHNDKTPSFTIFQTDEHFYCFGCREYGDVIKFIRLVEDLTFKQAVRTLYRFSQES
jgi:DNA primase